jgi:hypothetical protein
MSNFGTSGERRAHCGTARSSNLRWSCGVIAVLLAGCTGSGKKEPPSENGEGSAGMMQSGGTGGADEAAAALLPVCDDAQPARIAACVSGPYETKSLTGVVQAIESADLESCQVVVGNKPAPNQNAGYALVISDGEDTMRVSVMLPWTTPFANVGDTVTVTHEADYQIESESSGWVTVRDEDGELLLWIVLSVRGLDGVGYLPQPEIDLREGEATCTSGETNCGPITRGPIIAESGSDQASIAQGEMADVGDFVVLNAQNARGRSCGWPENRAVVAAVRQLER